jgi:hypothetical protein
MTCEELGEYYELYSLGLLEDGEKIEIDAHLTRGCALCRRSLEMALALNAALFGSVPAAKPSRRLKRRILSGIGVQHRGWGWAAVLAAACMLAISLWLSEQERGRAAELAVVRQALLESNAQRDRLQQALNFLDDPATVPVSFGKGQAAPPRGNVLVHPRLGVLLIASNLPPAQSGKIYEMWIIPKSGVPRAAGLFQSNASGNALYILAGPLDPADLGAIAVTLEPQAGSSAPTTRPIIVAPVSGA